MARAVDRAMGVDRPEKGTVRRLWLERVRHYERTAHDSATDLLLLTLAGAEGKDVKYLIERGVLEVTEVGSIAETSQGKVVAVENSPHAVVELQRNIPGLKILKGGIQDVLRGNSPVRYPDGAHENACRARVVNLDLNIVLDAVADNGEIDFPVLTWIRKFAEIHTTAPRRDWTLLLTLHGELHWTDEVNEFVQLIFKDNFAANENFRQSCSVFLGEEIFDRVNGNNICRFPELDISLQQKILMLLVPKKIIQSVQHQQWKIITRQNLSYGGNRSAPMVTWVLDFSLDQDLAPLQNHLYRENINSVTTHLGTINARGVIQANAAN